MMLLACGVALSAMAQEAGDVVGRVVTRVGRTPVQGARITLRTVPERTVLTDGDGGFRFVGVPHGVYVIAVDAVDFLFATTSVRVDVPVRDVGLITLSSDIATSETEGGMFDFTDESFDTGMAAPGMLSASRDPFDNVAGYKFSSMRFRARGLDGGLTDVHMNGIRLNDATTGYSPWSLWSGLNDATRNQESVGGLSTISDFGVGGVGGLTNIDSRAAAFRKGWRASVAHADAQYALRLMLSYGSGRRDDGWAWAFSVSTRQGRNYHIDGVYYNAWGYYASVDKLFGNQNRHRLALTVLGAPTKRGAQMAVTDEMYWLMRSNTYNPNWGWQEGKMRNARVRDYHEPLALLNYDFRINDRTNFSAAASFRFGRNGYSALDWFDARDPRPDYHGYLPSYYEYRGLMYTADGLIEKDFPFFKPIQQIHWEGLYQSNYMSTESWQGPNGTMYPSGRSHYIVSDRRTDQRDLNLNLKLSHEFNDMSKIIGGMKARMNRTHYFNVVKDLLGGRYWLNVDNFAYRDFPNNFDKTANNVFDLANPESLMVYKGDTYGHNYYAHIQDYSLWGIYEFASGFFQGYLAGEAGYNTFWREGLYKKGLFPDNSFGDSERSQFITYKAKLGLAYSITGMHRFSVNAVHMAEAPNFNNAFTSPRTRNSLIDGLKTVKTTGVDATYYFRAPYLTVRLTGYFNYIQDLTRVITFYDDTAVVSDDGATTGAFTNFAMSGIDQRHYGVEFGFRIPLQFLNGLSLAGAASMGDYTYVSNPRFSQTVDSSQELVYVNEIVRLNGFKVEGTPQTAVNLSLNYRSQNNWFLGFDANYFDRMYLSMNPMLRTDILSNTISDPNTLARFRRQERFDPDFILNASIGKLWYIQRRAQFGFNLEVKNLLNSTNIRTGGFEQMRVRLPRMEDQGFSAFDSKYFYLPGLNYFFNVYCRF
jgi:hypothetical protein